MKTLVFSARPHDREFLDAENRSVGHELVYEEAALDARTDRTMMIMARWILLLQERS